MSLLPAAFFRDEPGYGMKPLGKVVPNTGAVKPKIVCLSLNKLDLDLSSSFSEYKDNAKADWLKLYEPKTYSLPGFDKSGDYSEPTTPGVSVTYLSSLIGAHPNYDGFISRLGSILGKEIV